jgi:iron complex transport system permease protein
MVAAADIVARTIALPRELPVGIITALIGGPVFVYLVQRGSFVMKSRTQS